MPAHRPNVLFVMTDQQRFDTIAALGNEHVHTPNMDRLVDDGVTFTNAYSQCPVCVPARYNIRTGREPVTFSYYGNEGPGPAEGSVADATGPYLAQRMSHHGYRTFGIGKFHTSPKFEDLGYEVHERCEELYGSEAARHEKDAYGSFLAEEFPEYNFVEQPHGERTEMYYMPQMSPLPAEVTAEAWAADRALSELQRDDDRPFFGLVSFVGPHPPLAPPIPFNRMYDPEEMPLPVTGDPEIDHMDEQIPWMNYLIWAIDENGEMDDVRYRALKARYYAEVSYIDQCLGRTLDALEAAGQRENTIVCYYADHGEHLGDHRAWQKESFFEPATRVPFIVRWPSELAGGRRCDELVALTDLFGIATGAAGEQELRDGIDVLGMLRGEAEPRDVLFGSYGEPGTRRHKVMVRRGDWKYVHFTNGGDEQLFHLGDDPNELTQRLDDEPDIAADLREIAVAELQRRGVDPALDGGDLLERSYQERPRERVRQLPGWKGVDEFPEDPGAVLDDWELTPIDEFDPNDAGSPE